MLKFEWASPAARAKTLAVREAELGLLEIPNEQKPRRFALPMLAAVFAMVCAVGSISMAGQAEYVYRRSSSDGADASPIIAATGASPAVTSAGASSVTIAAVMIPSYADSVCTRSNAMVSIGGCRISNADVYTVGSAFLFVLTIVFITLGRRIFGK